MTSWRRKNPPLKNPTICNQRFPPATVYSYRFQFRDQRSADKVPCLHWWIPRLGLKLEETGKIPSKTEKVLIIFWGILCRGNIVITWSQCASNLPSLDLWLFPVSCSFLGKRLNQDQLQWGPSWKCRRGAYMLDTLGQRPLSISGRKKQIPFEILHILVKQGIVTDY